MYRGKALAYGRGLILVCLAAAAALIGSAAGTTAEVAAQDEPPDPVYPRIQLSRADLQEFPLIHSNMAVYDPSGGFIHDLDIQAAAVIENGQRLPLAGLEENSPGVQFVIAVTFGPAMGIRDGLGRSRYDYLLEGLAAWERPPDAETADDLSLVLDQGLERVHVSQPAEILETLNGYEIEPRQAVPSLQPLRRAVEIALDPTEKPGMQRAVLFITPPQVPEAITELQSLAAQAAQAGIRIFVWQVGSPEEIETPPARQLGSLASQTGGVFFNFSGVEALPDLEDALEPLRHLYEFSYQSAITSSGTYSITVEVQHNELGIVSAPQVFELSLQPPNPVFVGLPSQIEYQVGEDKTSPQQNEPDGSTASKKPPNTSEEYPVEILVEFPDGYRRELAGSALIVDGVVVTSQTSPPFDSFTWDLSGYTDSGQHTVQVEVTDTLGLRGVSMALPVEVIVEGGPSILARTLQERGPWAVWILLVLAVSLAFAGIGLVLVLQGRLQPYRLGRAVLGRAQSVIALNRQLRPDRTSRDRAGGNPAAPGAANGSDSQAGGSLPGWFKRIARTRPARPQQASAFLVPLSASEGPSGETPVTIGAGETVLGSDPNQATWAFSDPAIAPVHARLRIEDGKTFIQDEGTAAGTWVNYIPVPEQGLRLRQGDLVHIGMKSFQFKSSNPDDKRKLVILTEEPSP